MKNSQDHPNARSLVEVASRVNNLNAILNLTEQALRT